MENGALSCKDMACQGPCPCEFGSTPGKIVCDLAIALAVGGDCLADLATLRAEPGLFGPVASDPTVSRLIDTLTEQVVGYIRNEGYAITDYIALEIADNLEVGNRDPMALDAIVERLDHSQADVVILSACVQMPSLAAIQVVQDRIGKPVLSAAVATTYEILKALDLKPVVPNAGELLSGRY